MHRQCQFDWLFCEIISCAVDVWRHFINFTCDVQVYLKCNKIDKYSVAKNIFV